MEGITVKAATKESSKKAGFLLLEVVFITALSVASWLNPSLLYIVPNGWIPVLAILATLRIARTISLNEIAEVIRAPFTQVQQDSCGAGANVHPKGSGLQYVIGSLISCPICSGTWAAMLIILAWGIYEPAGRILIFTFGFAGGSEIIHWIAEFFEWWGRAGRVISGAISPDEE